MSRDSEFDNFNNRRNAVAARDNAVPSTARQTTLDKLAKQKAEQAAQPSPAPTPEQRPHVPREGSVSDATRAKYVERRREYDERKAAEREQEIAEQQTALLKTIANTHEAATSKAVHAIFGREVETVDTVREGLAERERAAWDRVANFNFRESSGDDFRKANALHQAALAELKQHDEGGNQ